MEALLFFGGIAFIAGIMARSLLVTQRPPQIIYVQTEPVKRGGGGCLFFMLMGFIGLVVLLVAGAV